MTKTCSKCKQEKPDDAFRSQKKVINQAGEMRDYKLAKCMACEALERNARRKKPRYDPHIGVHNDLKYKDGKKKCSSCNKEMPLHEFLIARHTNGGHLYRMSRCRYCSNKRLGQVHREYKYDRFRNRLHHYGEPERTKTGKWFRTEHLEQYLRKSWNPYITIPDNAGRWYEPIAVYPDEIPGTGEVFGCAA